MIYLDNAATTFPKPECVYEAMDRVNRNSAVNAGRGSYHVAREMTTLIDDTKNRLLELFHATGRAGVVFTPSITHAMNQIFGGLDYSEPVNVFTSIYEHNAVARTLNKEMEQHSTIIAKPLSIKDNGEIDIDKVKYQFSVDKPSLIVLTAISNTTGYIVPYREVFKLAKQVNPHCLTILDAAQAAGLIDIDFSKESIDILCFAGHKTLYGPFGIAGFLLRHGTKLDVYLTGGTGSDSLNKKMPELIPSKYEAASPNIIAIAGLNASLRELDIDLHYSVLNTLTLYLIQELAKIQKVRVLGNNGNNIGIVSFVVEGYLSADVGSILDDEFDIAVRTGYHCAPDVHDFLKDQAYGGTVRIGIGLFNTKEDINALINALKTL